MDLNVDEFVKGLLAPESHEQPSDEVLPKDEDFNLPQWFNKHKYEQGRLFFRRYYFALMSSLVLGGAAMISVPSILKVLINTRRSTTTFTSYHRYITSLLHLRKWCKYELKPNSMSWDSMKKVRVTHFRVNQASNLKGQEILSQRDMGLTLFSLYGLPVLKPEQFGIEENNKGDFDAYCHYWAVIGHMLGIKDKYNLGRQTYKETREVCQIVMDRVITPYMYNPPEFYKHMVRSYFEGVTIMVPLPILNVEALNFYMKWLVGVPGYVYTNADRMFLQKKLFQYNYNVRKGIDSSHLIQAVNGFPPSKHNFLEEEDLKAVKASRAYRKLNLISKLQIFNITWIYRAQRNKIARLVSNLFMELVFIMLQYFPLHAILRFGIRNAYHDYSLKSPLSKEVPKPNSYY